MTRSLTTVIFHLFLAYTAYGQDLVVHLNTNDCIRHLSPINALTGLSNYVHVKVLTPPENVKILPEILKRFGVDPRSLQITAFEEPKSAQDLCTYTNEHGAEFKFPFADLRTYVPVINRWSQTEFCKDSIPVPSDIVLSDRIDLTSGVNALAINDYLTAQVHLFSFMDTSIHAKVMDLGPDLKWELLAAKEVDTSYYNTNIALLLERGMGEMRVEGITFHGDTTSVIVGLAYPTSDEGSKTVGVTGTYAQVYVVDNKVQEFRILDEIIQADSAYFYTVSHAFGSTEGEVTMSVSKHELTTSPDYILAHLRPVDGKLQFQEFVDLLKPTFFDSTAFGPYDLTIGSFNGALYRMNYYPLMYDNLTGRSSDFRKALTEKGLGTLNLRSPNTYFCYDAHALTNGRVEVAFRSGGKGYLAILDMANSEIVCIQPHDLSRFGKESIRFLGNGQLVGLSTDRTWVYKL